MKRDFLSQVAKGISAADTGIKNVDADTLVTNILNTAYYIAGAVAVIMIIIAGVMYILASGDSGRVAKAKNILMYAVIGLIVILSAFAITNFVMGRLI